MNGTAIVGLGAMGSRMAARLLDAGHSVIVTSRDRARASALESAGARWADSPREAAAQAELVIAMVTDDAASRAVWQDASRGALEGLRPGSIAVESSTLTPRWTESLADDVGQRGAQFVAAPVVGSRPQAEAGALLYLAGGAREVVQRIEPVLRVMGADVQHLGSPAQAMTFKLAINTLFATQVAIWAEVLGVLERAGVDPSAAAERLGATPVASPALRGAAGAIAARRYDPQFPVALVHKDMGYFVETATGAGAVVPTAQAIRDVYGRAREAGHGDDNIVGVAKVVG